MAAAEGAGAGLSLQVCQAPTVVLRVCLLEGSWLSKCPAATHVPAALHPPGTRPWGQRPLLPGAGPTLSS